MARLKEQYKADIAPALFKKFGYKSTMQVPRIEKVVVNVGCGEARDNAKVLDAVARDNTAVAEPSLPLSNGLAAYLPFDSSATENAVSGSSVERYA